MDRVSIATTLTQTKKLLATALLFCLNAVQTVRRWCSHQSVLNTSVYISWHCLMIDYGTTWTGQQWSSVDSDDQCSSSHNRCVSAPTPQIHTGRRAASFSIITTDGLDVLEPERPGGLAGCRHQGCPHLQVKALLSYIVPSADNREGAQCSGQTWRGHGCLLVPLVSQMSLSETACLIEKRDFSWGDFYCVDCRETLNFVFHVCFIF